MRERQIVIVGRGRMVFLKVRALVYVETVDHGALLCCRNEKYPVRRSLEEIEKSLKGLDFIRVHRSFLISADHIREIHEDYIVMEGLSKIEIPIGPAYKARLMEEIKKRQYIFL